MALDEQVDRITVLVQRTQRHKEGKPCLVARTRQPDWGEAAALGARNYQPGVHSEVRRESTLSFEG